jgi:hypothetical protein
LLENPPERAIQVCTKALMQKLNESCSNLKRLELKYCDLSEITSEDLNDNLEEIYLIRCELPLKWFEKNKFKNLISLQLNNSSRICFTHIQDLTNTLAFTTLIDLNLSNCYRINDKSIELLVNYSLIKKLDLSGTDITQYGIQLICSKLSKTLQYLNLKNCKGLNENDLKFVKQSFITNDKFQFEF